MAQKNPLKKLQLVLRQELVKKEEQLNQFKGWQELEHVLKKAAELFNYKLVKKNS